VRLIFIGVLALAAGMFWRFGEALLAPAEASEQQLVYRTNHAKILEACRWIEAKRATLGLKGETIDNVGAVHDALPDVVRQLDLELIRVEDTGVMIYFGGGFGHWGFEAPHTDPTPQDDRGPWQLIPGRWYWNEWGRFPRDPAKPVRVRTSTLILAGGLMLIAAGIGGLRTGQPRQPGA